MDTEALVYVDVEGQPTPVGRLWARMRRGRGSASFEYDEEWLAHAQRFALEPALPLGAGPFHTAADKPMFGAFGDSAPDRWGRALMRRAERREAERTGKTPSTLREIDYLLRVNDEARLGALRFAQTPGGPFLASDEAKPIPPLVELPRLLSAAEHVAGDSDSDEDLRLLLAPGSSLGGARPKASVRDKDGHLGIAVNQMTGDDQRVFYWQNLGRNLREASSYGTLISTTVLPWGYQNAVGRIGYDTNLDQLIVPHMDVSSLSIESGFDFVIPNVGIDSFVSFNFRDDANISLIMGFTATPDDYFVLGAKQSGQRRPYCQN